MKVRILNRTLVLSLGLCSMLLLGAVAGKYASDLHLYYLTDIMCILITEYMLYSMCMFIKTTKRYSMDTKCAVN